MSRAKDVMDALYELGPMSVRQITDHFAALGDPIDNRDLRNTMAQLKSSGRIVTFGHAPHHSMALVYRATGSPAGTTDIEEIIRQMVRTYSTGAKFDQSEVADTLGISHDTARDAMSEMRRRGMLVKTYGPGRTRSLARYTINPRRTVRQ